MNNLDMVWVPEQISIWKYQFDQCFFYNKYTPNILLLKKIETILYFVLKLLPPAVDLEMSLAMQCQMSLQPTEQGIIVSKTALNDLYEPERLV